MMTPPGLFIIKEDNSLVGLSETTYESEDFLQNLLARYPSLLPGDQINPEAPRRWLLITRELGVPDDVDAANRWSLDHLFVDQEGIPTLVEVKRSTDTRIRREVIGQMLDYAANGVLHWPIDGIRGAFVKQCETESKHPDAHLQEFLGPDVPLESFWMNVKTNLQAGRIRLLFVADVVPAELKRVVEFLNNQMESAEVLAIEVRQYVGPGLRSLVPRVFGLTAQSAQRKSAGRRGVRWDETSFFAKLAEYRNPEATRVARELFDWARQRMHIDYGNGSKYSSFIPFVGEGDEWFGPFRCFTGGEGGYVEIPLSGSGMQAPPFNNADRKLELIRRLNGIPGIQVAEDLTKFPSIGFGALADTNRLKRFLEVIDWTLTLVKEEGLK